jgi:hypothetical protein
MIEAAIGFVLVLPKHYITEFRPWEADLSSNSAAKLLEVVVDVLFLQMVPLVVGQRTKEGMLGSETAWRHGQALNQFDDALAVGLEAGGQTGK